MSYLRNQLRVSTVFRRKSPLLLTDLRQDAKVRLAPQHYFPAYSAETWTRATNVH